MTRRAFILGVGLVILPACSRPGGVVPESRAALVAGDPTAVYERALPELRREASPGTEIVRIDESGEAAAITLRFSVSGDDRSVRLVEVRMTSNDAGATSVRVRSRRFTFLRSAGHDAIDLEVENKLLALLEQALLAPSANLNGPDTRSIVN